MPLAVYLNERPDHPATVMVEAEMDNHAFRYRESLATYHHLYVRDPRTRRGSDAWVRKDTRVGRVLFEILKDGGQHVVTLEVALYRPDGTRTPPDENTLYVMTDENYPAAK
jgi:hypothetical protein